MAAVERGGDGGPRCPVDRTEAVLVIAIVIIGLGLRLWRLSHLGINHFDEGVYAFSALGLTDGNQPHRLYPGQVVFSPPVFLGLVGLAFLLAGGPSDTAAALVSVATGTLTIAAVWWIGRRWFDPAAGIAAAVLVACSTFHIAHSRGVLTDVTFALALLLALAAVVSAVERNSLGRAALAGLLIGVAWNTKYHGWFAGVVAAGALVPYGWQQSRRGVSPWRLLALLAVIGAVAAAAYLPWALFVHAQPGGYGALAQVHRLMVNANYLGNLWRQLGMQLFFDGPLSRASVPLAIGAAALCRMPGASRRWSTIAALSGAGAASLLIGGAGVVAVLALLTIPARLRRPWHFPSLVAIGWAALFIISLPLYQAYARLAVPLVVAAALLAGAGISAALGAATRAPSAKATGRTWLPACAVLAAIAVGFLPARVPDASDPWADLRGFERAAAQLEPFIPAGSPVVVVAEPPLAFYLHLADRPAFNRVSDLGELERRTEPAFVVAGMYVREAPEMRAGLERLVSRLERLADVRVDPGDIRLLGRFAPPEARAFRAAPDDTYTYTLYRLKPPTLLAR